MKNPVRLTASISIALAFGAIAPADTQAAIPASQREALIAFYNSTDGPNWQVYDDTWLGPPGTECEWYGITCNSEQTGVIEIDLGNKGLGGVLPPEIGDLVDLEGLILNNNQIGGELPPEIGNLVNLARFVFYYNTFTGSLPEIGDLSNLREIHGLSSGLSGPLPAEIGNLAAIESIYLPANRFSGPIPAEIGNLSTLRSLHLFSNELEGSIPPEIGGLHNIEELSLSRNRLSGSIPPEISALSTLLTLELDYNELEGTIPAALGNMAAIQIMYFAGNRLDGPIPPELADIDSLEVLSLGGNRLTGSIPDGLGTMSNLRSLSLTSNRLRGTIPPSLGDYCTNGGSLNLSFNALEIPDHALADILDDCGAGWWRKQGVPPSDPIVVGLSARWATFAWTPIEWIEAGSYEIQVTTDLGGRMERLPTTGLLVNKDVDRVTAVGLEPDTTYTAIVRSISYPVENRNTIVSDASVELVFTTLPAEAYHVASTGDDQADCLSPSTACRTIQAAIDKATSGDAVSVAPGTYTENIVIDKDLVIRGASAATTRIDGDGLGTVVFVGSGTTVEIRDFTITTGLASTGGGVYNSGAKLFVIASEISGNHAISDGGALFNQGGLLVVEDSTIAENTASTGAVLGTPETEVETGVSGFRNSTLSGNTSTHPHSRVISPVTLFNCTVTDNRAGLFGYILEGGPVSSYLPGPESRLQHTVIGGNHSPNCRVQRGEYMGHNLADTDDCFVEWSSFGSVVPDLLLGPIEANGGSTRTHAPLPGSPIIDAGDTDGAPLRDQRGFTRPMDGDSDGIPQVDPGAFELQSAASLVFADGFESGDLRAWSGGSQ